MGGGGGYSRSFCEEKKNAQIFNKKVTEFVLRYILWGYIFCGNSLFQPNGLAIKLVGSA